MLKADHRQVESLFEQFEDSDDDSEKEQLAQQICEALTVHTKVEEEIFYPAFLEATDEKDTHHEAIVEHAGAKKLIKEIEATSPDDDESPTPTALMNLSNDYLLSKGAGLVI